MSYSLLSDEVTAKTRHRTWRCNGCRKLAVTGLLVIRAAAPPDPGECLWCKGDK